MDFPVGGPRWEKEGPTGPINAGEFRETVLTETESPPLANTALGHMHLVSSSRVQLEGDSPTLFHLWSLSKQGPQIRSIVLYH